MTDGFHWGGINIRQFSRYFLGNLWMVIAIMIITYLGLGFVDKQTYSPSYTSTAVAAVYPKSSSYRYHTIETVWDLASKTEDISSVLNSDLFESAFHNQDPSLQDCAINSRQIENTDLLVLYATSGSPEIAFKGIRSAVECYSRFSGEMTGVSEIKIILGPEAPYPVTGSSKIQNYRPLLCILSGLMMAGLLLFIYISRKTYKTEHRIKKHYKDIRFFSLPFIESGSEHRKGILSKKKSQEPTKILALEIKQVMHKCDKHTLLVTFPDDKAGGTAILSALAGEIAKQDEKVILVGMESLQDKAAPGIDSAGDMKKNSLREILQQKCTVKDAMLYSEELSVSYIQCSPGSFDEYISYSVDDVRRVLFNCQEQADIVLINGSAWYPFHDAQIWRKAVDATIALCRQDGADFYTVDKMLRELKEGDAYFAGCVLFGF